MTRVVVTSSASANTPWAAFTAANRLEYCARHGYDMHVRCQPYDQSLEQYGRLLELLDVYDLVWGLDIDALITNQTIRIEDVPGLGPHASICEEGLGDLVLINAGSMVWRSTDLSRQLVAEIVASKPEWQRLEFNIQSWLEKHRERLSDRLTICPKRAFNSAHHDKTCVWEPGDFVYHPCGNDAPIRCAMLQEKLAEVVR